MTQRKPEFDAGPQPHRVDEHGIIDAHGWPRSIPLPAKTGRGGIPAILSALGDRLGRYFHAPSEWLPALNAANGSRRQQRSERRVACVQILRAALKYCDLATLRIGVPQADGTWLNLTVPFLAEQAGLDLRRAERALHDLQSASLLRVRPQCERVETAEGFEYRGLAAIKYLPPSLFAAFGLGQRLAHERTRAQLRAHRKVAAERKRNRRSGAAVENLAQMAKAARAAQKHAVGKRHSEVHRADERSKPDHDRAVILMAGLLKEKHPEWDRETCYEQAIRLLA